MPKTKRIALVATALVTMAAVLALVLFLHLNDTPPGDGTAPAASRESAESVESVESVGAK